jgi:hypothetical protein
MSQGKTDYTHALKPFGITELMKHEEEVEQSMWIEPDGRFMVHPARFIAAVRAAVTKAGRAVYIGADRVIHLTSRTAPKDAAKVARPAQMLHDELIVHPTGRPGDRGTSLTAPPAPGTPVDSVLLCRRKRHPRTGAAVARTRPRAGRAQTVGKGTLYVRSPGRRHRTIRAHLYRHHQPGYSIEGRSVGVRVNSTPSGPS